ncbi:response regulator [Caldimonas tepidiphila]|uniref:response regulator n=1 Tax=Caldimonas tepidiphila TaxID=2315841 RepID=UPI000E5B986E|nr:response regulator [Caldimonas tepidiphila]
MQRVVLIVDDNEMLFKLYRSLLSPMDCVVAHAASRQDAVRSLHREKPDLIILNHRLRDGSGEEAVREIRRLDRHTPILAMTSSPQELDEEAVRRAGYASVLAKPFQRDAFVKLAQRLMQEEPPGGAPLPD